MRLNTTPRVIAAIIIVAFIVIIATVIGAAAQEVITGDPALDSNIERAVGVFDLVLRLLGMVILFFGSLATSKLPGKLRQETDRLVLEKEREWRAAMHKAVISGVRAGLAEGLRGGALVNFALKHTIASTPDAIAGLIPSTKDIVHQAPEIVLRQLPAPIRAVLERIVQSYTISDPHGEDDLTNALRDAGAPVVQR